MQLGDRGIYHPSQPTWHDQFRSNTAKHATCAGITSPRFVCKCCGRSKPTSGRKPLVKGTGKFGYKCADCAARA